MMLFGILLGMPLGCSVLPPPSFQHTPPAHKANGRGGRNGKANSTFSTSYIYNKVEMGSK